MLLDPVIFVKKNTSESKKHFTSSASKYNEMKNKISTEAILLSDSCVERIKEIADDTSYLRVMVRYQFGFQVKLQNLVQQIKVIHNFCILFIKG